MTKDKLFLLKPDFMDGTEGPFYCPESAPIEGLLSYYPKLREELEVSYLDFPRPRQAISAEIGAENQGMPVLVLKTGGNLPEGVLAGEALGKKFISGDKEICRYLSEVYGIGRAHP
ncbi:hypothetical protein GMLC_22450 [Geomonas limicola]|uniref:DUF3088 domain-containing protein n=1 Tax=Geomonas limicola TaxID=2740186 RepID=A0A6V8N7V9_9BACT|nr:DUF3088 domain-containing protein [Geomonas limicola]GFO68666.1 hypothetical protein GMLC_22450 [Geomonas limicola]